MIDFTGPTLVVCEGNSDEGFLARLSKSRQLAGIDVIYPRPNTAGCGGIRGVPTLLKAIQTAPKWKNVMSLGIVVDADDGPDSRLSEIRGWVEAIGLTLNEAYKIHSGKPSIGVFLLPGRGMSGTLEDLLFRDLQTSRQDLVKCVDQFAKCLRAPPAWPRNEYAKMRVHALLAGCCEEEPATNLANAWSKIGCPFDIDSSVYDEVADFLCSLRAAANESAG